jgi:hypothetical protein
LGRSPKIVVMRARAGMDNLHSGEHMNFPKNLISLGIGLALSVALPSHAQVPDAKDRGYMDVPESGGTPGESNETQIARAVAAGPSTITGNAQIVGIDANGTPLVLREGSNGFLCQPGNPKIVGRPATCSNESARQWSADLAAGKPSPTNTELGIIYMQAGATERGASGQTITSGPQWIITWPFDPKASGLSATKKDTGAFIRWAGTPYAHLNVMGQAVGAPTQHLASDHAGHMPAMGVHDGSAKSAPTNESAEAQIARAISAGPKHVTDGAQLTGTDGQGNKIVLREGDNGFTCTAGSLKVVAEPPTCRSTKSKPTIMYMLAGATQRSVTDPTDAKSPALAIAPHWMIMTRFDPKKTGIPEHYSDTGAYAMWVEARSAHLHINGVP